MTTPTPTPARRSTPARQKVPLGSVILIVAGAIIGLIALAPVAAGGFLVWAYATQRDDAGYFTTAPQRFETTSSAITTERIDLGANPTPRTGTGEFGDTTIRLAVTSTAERPVFVGIARQADLDRYLSGVSHAEVQNVTPQPGAGDARVSYRYVDGTAAAAQPATQPFWVASAHGTGQQSIQWPLTRGEWAAVVMNADASPGVSVHVTAGAQAPWVAGLGVGLLVGGAFGAIVGAILLVTGVIALARGTEIDLTVTDSDGASPIRLEGRLDEPLNRGLWLVKWLLLIPHLIVLAVLWIAFTVVTLVAFFAILFTGRYPRSLFEFNAGVLRWTWRVAYYGYSALGTDRYPPFSLGHHPDYPATFEIDYPERLSRGLVLIKWWLLAIPQYLVLGLILGGAAATFGEGARLAIPAGGLIGLLVLFAALALLFTGTYPRGLHDLVMGLNRWVYRVVPYLALMRDEYPPFRLDQGPTEPTSGPPHAPRDERPASRTVPSTSRPTVDVPT